MVGSINLVGATAGTAGWPAPGGPSVSAQSPQAGFAAGSPEFLVFAHGQGAVACPSRFAEKAVAEGWLKVPTVPSLPRVWWDIMTSESAHEPWLTGSLLGTIVGASYSALSQELFGAPLWPIFFLGTCLGSIFVVINPSVRWKHQETTLLGSLIAGLATFFSPPLGGALAVGPSIVSAWRAHRAIKQLQAASRDPDLVRQFFEAHPELYRDFLNGPFTKAFTDEKQRAEAKIQALRTKIAKFNKDKEAPGLQSVNDYTRNTIICALEKKIAECTKAIALLQQEVIAPIDGILQRIPGFAEAVSAQIRQHGNLEEVSRIAAEAEMDDDVVITVEADIAEARVRLARAIQEATDTLDGIQWRLAADVEVAALTMPGTDPLAAQIATLGTEEVEIAPAPTAAAVETAAMVAVAEAR